MVTPFRLLITFIICTATLVWASKYILVPINQHWADAEQYCNTRYGTSLASIHSWDDNAEASALCKAGCTSCLPYLLACSIGLNDKTNERGTNRSGWVWTDGSKYDWQFWRGIDEPSDVAENDDCVTLFVDDHPTASWQSRWVTVKCDLANFYALCNTPPALFPTLPPTLSRNPSQSPTNPSHSPTNPAQSATNLPAETPTNDPSQTPTNDPTNNPTNNPINSPTYHPSNNPTKGPTNAPSHSPTVMYKEGSVVEIISTMVTDSSATFTGNISTASQPQTGVILMVIFSVVIVVVTVVIVAVICKILRWKKKMEIDKNNMNEPDSVQRNVTMEIGNKNAVILDRKYEGDKQETDTNHMDDLDAIQDLDVDQIQNEYVTSGGNDVNDYESDEENEDGGESDTRREGDDAASSNEEGILADIGTETKGGSGQTPPAPPPPPPPHAEEMDEMTIRGETNTGQ